MKGEWLFLGAIAVLVLILWERNAAPGAKTVIRNPNTVGPSNSIVPPSVSIKKIAAVNSTGIQNGTSSGSSISSPGAPSASVLRPGQSSPIQIAKYSPIGSPAPTSVPVAQDNPIYGVAYGTMESQVS
jgi:hypothetical protein